MDSPAGHFIVDAFIDELFIDDDIMDFDDAIGIGLAAAIAKDGEKARNAALARSDAKIRFMSSVL